MQLPFSSLLRVIKVARCNGSSTVIMRMFTNSFRRFASRICKTADLENSKQNEWPFAFHPFGLLLQSPLFPGTRPVSIALARFIPQICSIDESMLRISPHGYTGCEVQRNLNESWSTGRKRNKGVREIRGKFVKAGSIAGVLLDHRVTTSIKVSCN